MRQRLSSARVRFAAKGLLAACVGDVCFKIEQLGGAEAALDRAEQGVARVYDDAAEREGGR